jgi:murein L,D-transpeptidase YcbB/YkuD
MMLKAVGLAVLTTIVCSTDAGAPPCGAGCVPLGDLIATIREVLPAELSGEGHADVRRLYAKVGYEPVWIVNSRLSRQAVDVITYLRGIDSRGLRATDYAVDELGSLVAGLDSGSASPALLARIELSLSRTLFRALADLHRGRVDPAALGIDLPRGGSLDLERVIVDVSRAENVAPVIESVEPAYPGYAALIVALSRYRVLADSGLMAPPDPARVVRPGESYPGVHHLARVLAALGDLPSVAVPAPGDERFDGVIVDAVTAFQRRHGLEPDGVLGRATMATLRVPVHDRIRQIELALERWRWLPHEPPQRYILVNLPEFRLRAYDRRKDAQSTPLALNVIIGQARGHRTPIFSATMREVVFHPYWDVPLSIARNELVPIIKRKPEYLINSGFEIVRGPGKNEPVYAATAGNLARVAAGTLRLRQRPGPGNALGTVKLVFPNPYRVFLHDTPGRGLFARPRRDFSHGCIRVEHPATLAEFVLGPEPGWDATAVHAALGEMRTRQVNVTEPLTVYVQYFTASVDEAGVLHFHPDLYRRDAALAAALNHPTN